VCVGKSAYAHCGIIVNVTPLEPEWRGRVTIEISNATPLPAKIYTGEGIAQILFLKAEAVCRTSYADKKGKYQDQPGLTLPFVQQDAPTGHKNGFTNNIGAEIGGKPKPRKVTVYLIQGAKHIPD